MFITPIQQINGMEGLTPIKSATENNPVEVPFKGLFENALNNVYETEKVSSENLELLATGQSDDLHNITIDSTKAQLSMQTLISLRSKALDAYSEILRINL